MLNRLILQINNKCNLNCPFCYVHKGRSEIDYETAKKAVDFFFGKSKIEEYGQKEIIIMGGEPLLSRETLRKIILYIRKKYGRLPMVGLPSNLHLLNAHDVYFFRKMGIQLSWSVYPGWERILRDKNFLIAPEIKKWLKIKFTVGSSLNDIFDFFETFLALKNRGFEYFDVTPVIGTFWPRKNMKLFLENIKEILAFAQNKEIKFVRLDDCFNNVSEKKSLAFCPRLNYEFFIDYQGRVFPCQWYSSFLEPEKEKLKIGLIDRDFDTLPEKIKSMAEKSLSYRSCHDLGFECSECDYNLNCQKFCLGHPHLAKDNESAKIARNNIELMNAFSEVIEKIYKE